MSPAPCPRRARDARAIAATCAWLSACEPGVARYTGCPPDDGYRPWTEHDVFPIDLRRAVALPHTVLVPADGTELNAPLLRELLRPPRAPSRHVRRDSRHQSHGAG